MDQKPLALLVALLILTGAIAAGWYLLSQPSPTPEAPDGTIVLPSDSSETIEDTGPYHEITATYPREVPVSVGSTEARALMQSFAQNEVARFKEENVAILTPEDVAFLSLGGTRIYTLDITYVPHLTDDTASYVFSLFVDTLGAHPNAYYRTFTFDRSTGAPLRLEDLFTAETDYLALLSSTSRASLTAHLGEEGLDKEYMEAGTTPDPDNFQNFYLTENDLVIIFPPYQIGPWVLGTQEVRIPHSELSDALKAQYR